MNGMEEVIGSIPIRSTKIPKILGELRRVAALCLWWGKVIGFSNGAGGSIQRRISLAGDRPSS